MLFEDILFQLGRTLEQLLQRAERHLGDRFERDGVLPRLPPRLCPRRTGAWPATSTAGIAVGSKSGKPLDDHAARVPLRTLSSTSCFVSGRVTGTGPKKWSACVVPKHGISMRAWANIGGVSAVRVRDAADRL